MKYVYILFSRFNDPGSRLSALVTRYPYTHAGLSVDQARTFYSFVHKGFVCERPGVSLSLGKKACPCRLYRLPVSDGAYERICTLLRDYRRRRRELRYSNLGVLLGLMRLPLAVRRGYFCSQFVAEVLQRAHAAVLMRRSEHCFLRDLAQIPGMRLLHQGDWQTLQDYRKQLLLQ